MTLDANTVRTVLGMLQGPKIDNDAWVHDVRIDEDETGIDLTVAIGPEERPGVAIAEAKQDLYTRLGARPDVDGPGPPRPAAHPAHRRPGRRRPRLRLAGLHPGPARPPGRRHRGRAAQADAGGRMGALAGTGGAVTLTNGLVTVAVDPTDGTFAVDGLAGFGRLVDGGDLGDSYNYSPPRRDSLGRHPRVGDGRPSATAARSGPPPSSPPPTAGPTTSTARPRPASATSSST